MVPFSLGESIELPATTDEVDVPREGVAVSIYPITAAQWQALQDAAKARGGDRSGLVREAITYWLDKREQETTRFIYPAAPRLTPEEKATINPRAVWLKEPLLGRMRQRCVDDRVQQSEFCLHAIRAFLASEGIEIDPPL